MSTRDAAIGATLRDGRDVAGWLGWQVLPGSHPTRPHIWAELVEPDPPAAAEALPPEESLPPVPELRFSEAEVARFCAAAAADAAAAAVADARDRQAEALVAAQNRLADALTRLDRGIAARRGELQARAVAVGADVGRALAWEALRQEPMAAAMAMLGELLPDLAQEPEITVRLPEAEVEALREPLAAMARACGCSNLLDLRGDATLRAGEVRVRWRDGWAERLLADVEARLASALSLLAGRPAGGPPAVDMVEITEDRT